MSASWSWDSVWRRSPRCRSTGPSGNVFPNLRPRGDLCARPPYRVADRIRSWTGFALAEASTMRTPLLWAGRGSRRPLRQRPRPRTPRSEPARGRYPVGRRARHRDDPGASGRCPDTAWPRGLAVVARPDAARIHRVADLWPFGLHRDVVLGRSGSTFVVDLLTNAVYRGRSSMRTSQRAIRPIVTSWPARIQGRPRSRGSDGENEPALGHEARHRG